MQSQYTARRNGTWPDGTTVVNINYLVVAGGGKAAGGGGGFRTSYPGDICGQGSALLLTPGPYAIVVGGGGGTGPSCSPTINQGNDSSFNAPGTDGVDAITSAGGGAYGNPAGTAGGSGGGSRFGTNAAGNTPPVTPPQGNPGGQGQPAELEAVVEQGPWR